ncbi:hypothetical protein Bbelb_150990 [Branchiostoma belcheri]|nr:hypothetical protein Bbelb_150990 [Branchiostoma belcheri]
MCSKWWLLAKPTCVSPPSPNKATVWLPGGTHSRPVVRIMPEVVFPVNMSIPRSADSGPLASKFCLQIDGDQEQRPLLVSGDGAQVQIRWSALKPHFLPRLTQVAFAPRSNIERLKGDLLKSEKHAGREENGGEGVNDACRVLLTGENATAINKATQRERV